MVSYRGDVEFLQALGFDRERITEVTDLLSATDSPEELCDAPFRPKLRLQRNAFPERFSDGSFAVFYSSLDPKTAEAEVRHWFTKFSEGRTASVLPGTSASCATSMGPSRTSDRSEKCGPISLTEVTMDSAIRSAPKQRRRRWTGCSRRQYDAMAERTFQCSCVRRSATLAISNLSRSHAILRDRWAAVKMTGPRPHRPAAHCRGGAVAWRIVVRTESAARVVDGIEIVPVREFLHLLYDPERRRHRSRSRGAARRTGYAATP